MTLTKREKATIQDLIDLIATAKDNKGRKIGEVFIDLPPKKDLPDYYKVVTRPASIESIRSKLRGHKFPSFDLFLRDVAQIFYNAKLYNMKNSVIYEDAGTIEDMVNNELEKLKEEGLCEEDELPVIGELPDGNETETEEPKTKKQKLDTKEEDDEEEEGDLRRRGRPPKIETSEESVMKNVLKAIRKVKRGDTLLYEPFEKLPNANEYPDYYQHIKDPQSLALVKKTVKKKTYENNFDQFVKDVKQIFLNARYYNENSSSIYKDATHLLNEVDGIVKAEQERQSQEDEAMEGSRPQTAVNSISQDGQAYTTGDWVHIRNVNDPKHPIVAQIFKTWQKADGTYWVNACWYYHPWQTVHRADRVWMEHEVVKTGQYRDHPISDIMERCFVMYVTRYAKGRPPNFDIPEDRVYVCESRYNQDQRSFNRIKAWKSCVPEETREEAVAENLVPFTDIRNPKRYVSPLLHLMPKDRSLWVDPTEEVKPEPLEPGSSNGPPIMGNIIVSSVPGDALAREETQSQSESRDSKETIIAKREDIKPSTPTVMPRPAPPRLASSTRRESQLPPAQQITNALVSLGHPTSFVVPFEAGTMSVDGLQTDANGNILWYSVPPLNPVNPHTEGGVRGHSIAWLAHKLKG